LKTRSKLIAQHFFVRLITILSLNMGLYLVTTDFARATALYNDESAVVLQITGFKNAAGIPLIGQPESISISTQITVNEPIIFLNFGNILLSTNPTANVTADSLVFNSEVHGAAFGPVPSARCLRPGAFGFGRGHSTGCFHVHRRLVTHRWVFH
jgi:hypothetical protein